MTRVSDARYPDRVRCPECGHWIEGSEDALGTVYRCENPTCGAMYTADELFPDDSPESTPIPPKPLSDLKDKCKELATACEDVARGINGQLSYPDEETARENYPEVFQAAVILRAVPDLVARLQAAIKTVDAAICLYADDECTPEDVAGARDHIRLSKLVPQQSDAKNRIVSRTICHCRGRRSPGHASPAQGQRR